ncbi:hypothetical protein VTH82DRAFT_4968 [Thermothelomyces myriococcoides]
MERRFRPGIRERTRRIPEEVWERLKPVIIELYNTMTLGAVKERMEEEHNFTATKRQYIHQLKKWGVGKYKKGRSIQSPEGSPSSTDSGSDAAPVVDAKQLYVIQIQPSFNTLELRLGEGWFQEGNPAPLLSMADMLPFVGDLRNAGRIVMGQWERNQRRLGGAWLSTARANMGLEAARELAKPSGSGRHSWEAVTCEIRYAFTYLNDVSRAKHGVEQLADILLNRITYQDDQGADLLEQLTRRVSGLDTVAYVYLCAALVGYNSAHTEDKRFNVGSILQQFVNQQLSNAAAPLGPRITCLWGCLRWCEDKLGKMNTTGALPPQVPRPAARQDPGVRPRADELFTVYFALYHHLRQESGHRFPSRTRPAWVLEAESQLGIGPLYLLGIVTFMILAVDMLETCQNAASRPILERALMAARGLVCLADSGQSGKDDLLHAYLRQACAMAWPLAGVRDEDLDWRLRHIRVDPASMEPYRRYVAESFGITNLPPAV